MRRAFVSICVVGAGLALPPMPVAAQRCAYGPRTCLPGYVWRETSPEDFVCVIGAVRAQVWEDNRQALARRAPEGGPWGVETCRAGFVWRDAFPGDKVCVVGATRDQAARDNAAALSRWDPVCMAGDVGPSDAAAIRAYLDGLPRLALVQRRSGSLEPIPNLPEGVSGTRRVGGTFVNEEAELAVLKAYPDVVWPGSLVQGRSIGGNEFAPIVLPRAPGRVRLATNFVGGAPASKFADLPVVAAGEVEQARDRMLREIAPTDSVGTMVLSTAVASTVREAMVKLGVAYKGASFEGSANANLNTSYNENTIFAKFTQMFYTLVFDPDPNAASPFFAAGVGLPEVQRWAQPENPPLFVSEVKYGRVLLLSFTASMSKTDIEAAIRVVYSGGGASADAAHKEALGRMKIDVVSIGATGAVARDPLLAQTPEKAFDALRSYIDNGIRYSLDNPGAPIAFTMRYVGSRAGGGPFASAVAQMVTENSPEVVSLTATEVCKGGYQVWDGPGGGWRDIGLDVNPGDVVRFKAGGRNHSGVIATGLHGPTGWYTWDKPAADARGFPINNRSPFALIARFGGANVFGKDKTGGVAGTPGPESSSFYVGDSAQVTAGRDPTPGYGRIFLGTNDNDPTNGDADERFSVEVCTTRKIY